MVNCPLCDAVIDVDEEELDEGDSLVCEECGAKQFEDERDTGERPEHQKGRDECAGNKRPEPSRPGSEELHSRADGNQIGRDV